MRAFHFGVIALPLAGAWAGCGDDEQIFAPASAGAGGLNVSPGTIRPEAGESSVSPCERNNGGCSTHAYCSFDRGRVECECKRGYYGDGFDCLEFDVCSQNNGGCSKYASCHSAGATAICTCRPGFEGDGRECEDIDECAENNGGCDVEATCRNRMGSFDCGCPEGFQGDGETCIDSNECAKDNGGCSLDATCVNTRGSRECRCNPGFDGDGETCEVIDECGDENPCAVDAICSQTDEGPGCTCKVGYEGDGKTCEDVDECATDNGGCHGDATCTNLPGSRNCDCLEGFAGDGFDCQDIDECAKSNGGCSENATCENLTGPPKCTCKEGFAGDGYECLDIDECRTNHGGCAENADCINLPGSRRCSCRVGTVGDGQTCAPAEMGYTTAEIARNDCDDLSAAADHTTDACYVDAGCKGAGGKATNSVDLDFPFRFFGRPVNKFYLAQAGYLRLLEEGFAAYEFNQCPNPAHVLGSEEIPNGIVAPFWSCLTPQLDAQGISTSTVKYLVLGSAPRRHLTAEWRNFRPGPGEPSTVTTLTFQVKLFEASNRIEFHYCNMQTDDPSRADWIRGISDASGDPQIGLESGDTVRSTTFEGPISQGLRYDVVQGGPDCAVGYADCDGDLDTGIGGCEINLLTDPQHCGSCGATPCPSSPSAPNAGNGSAACDFGRCTLSCEAGYSDCNGVASDGCEISIVNNIRHCGGCGRYCNDGWIGRCDGTVCR